MPDENLAYKAGWIAKSFTVSFIEDGYAGINVTYDQPYDNLPVPAGRSGYVFSGWFTGLKNTTYTAIWTMQTYSVTLQTAGSALSPGSDITSYTYGSAVALPTGHKLSKIGYTFDGWSDGTDMVTEIRAFVLQGGLGTNVLHFAGTVSGHGGYTPAKNNITVNNSANIKDMCN